MHPQFTPRDSERFWSKVEKTEDCWLWTAHIVGGLGRFKIGVHPIAAHRFSWILAYGAIPDGLLVRHRCGTGLCVRPDHLSLATRGDPLSERHRRAIGDALRTSPKAAAYAARQRGVPTGRMMSEERRAFYSALFKGKPLPAEHRAKLSAAKKGRRMSEEDKALRRATARRGADHPSWKGGASPHAFERYKDPRYKEWRIAVMQRDCGTCQRCGRMATTRRARDAFHAHHLQSWAAHPELRYDVANGLLLCPPCHVREHGGALVIARPKPPVKRGYVPPERRARGERSGAYIHPEKMPRGERHGMAKLTWPEVRAIRAAYDPTQARGNQTMGGLARLYGVSLCSISNIVKGHTWREDHGTDKATPFM